MARYPVSSGGSFEKYRLARRIVSELRYGVGTARVVWRTAPERLVVCNMPLLSLLIVSTVARVRRCATVMWLQDVQSGLAASIIGERHVAARFARWLEGFLIGHADRVIAISDALASEAIRLGADPTRVSMLENWAPIDRLPTRAKDNEWARRRGLADSNVYLYSGTLARKHSPGLLLELADAVADRGDQVVVVSEGPGVDGIRGELVARPRPNVTLLPFQPFGDLSDVLATGDVLITLLDRNAAEFSVPSKTLAYLCAGRPVVASIPEANAAAELLRRSGAGVVVDPDDTDGFVAAAIRLMSDTAVRERMGGAGRAWAERHFAPDETARRFLACISERPGDGAE
jgi:glycosyltransferase involved in cell wall biosynthesis